MSTQFQTTLAERFANLSDIAVAARPSSMFSQLAASSDLSSIIRQPIDIGGIFNPTPISTPPAAPPLTPIDASNFIGIVAQTPQQILTAAVHGARVAFEAIPVAQDGDEIDAAIPNAFRSAMITLLSLAEGAITQLMRRQPVPLPPVLTGPPVASPPPVFTTPPILTTPPTQIDPGIIHINPGVLTQLATPTPAVTQPAGGGAVSSPQSTLPLLDLGGQVFQPITATHPETGAPTTIFAPVTAAGLAGSLSPVSGGGFHVTFDAPASPGAVAAAGSAATGPQLGGISGLGGPAIG